MNYSIYHTDKIAAVSYKKASQILEKAGSDRYIYKIDNKHIGYNAYSRTLIIVDIIALIIAILLYVSYKKKINSIIVFVIFYAFISSLYLIYNPVYASYDEGGHFLRSYELSNGIIVSVHNPENGAGITYAPKQLSQSLRKVSDDIGVNEAYLVYEKERAYLNKSFDKNDLIMIGNENQSLYSPASYIPSSIGLMIGKLFTNNVWVLYQLGRFISMLINAFLVIMAFYLCPERSGIICLVSSTPIFLSQMTTYSADGNLNSLSIFFFAYIMYLRKKSSIGIFDRIVIICSSLIIALSKIIYFPFVFAVFLIPDKAFNNKKRGILFKISICFISFIAFAAWFVVAKSFLSDSSGRGIYPDYQMKYLIEHIYLFPVIVIKTVMVNYRGWILSFLGGHYDMNNIRLNKIASYIAGIVMIFDLAVSEKDCTEDQTIKSKLFLLCIIILIVGLTFSSLYVQWTPYKSETVEGVQGRYFIPLMMPFSLTTMRFKLSIPTEVKNLAYILIMLMINIYSISFLQYVFS